MYILARHDSLGLDSTLVCMSQLCGSMPYWVHQQRSMLATMLYTDKQICLMLGFHTAALTTMMVVGAGMGCTSFKSEQTRADHLEHLNKGDSEVEVDSVAKVQSERHEEADRHDPQHVEAHGHGALDLHHMQNLQATTARVVSTCQATFKIHTY